MRFYCRNPKSGKNYCLNPCLNGRGVVREIELVLKEINLKCLNPCLNGRGVVSGGNLRLPHTGTVLILV